MRAFRKIKEVGYVDLDIEENRDIIKRGLLLGQRRFCGEQECLILDAKTKKIERVPKGAILQGRTLRKLERKLAKYYEGN